MEIIKLDSAVAVKENNLLQFNIYRYDYRGRTTVHGGCFTNPSKIHDLVPEISEYLGVTPKEVWDALYYSRTASIKRMRRITKRDRHWYIFTHEGENYFEVSFSQSPETECAAWGATLKDGKLSFYAMEDPRRIPHSLLQKGANLLGVSKDDILQGLMEDDLANRKL